LKIVNLCFQDFGGGAFTLSHAINKIFKGKHKAINVRSTGDYIAYPAIVEMKNYTVPQCQKMVYNADVVVYHSWLKPYFEGLMLDPTEMENKKNILFFHGSELRNYGPDIIKQADELLGNYTILVSTMDLLPLVPKDAKWLATCRSFSEISRRYALCNQDQNALKSFGIKKQKVVFTHAPTSEVTKGSAVFYRVMTQLMKVLPYVLFKPIRHQPWSNVLRILPTIDVMFDRYPPPELGTGYGNVAVEASIFKVPTVTKLNKQFVKTMKRETGFDNPFIAFDGEDDLTAKVIQLAEQEKLRKICGNLAYTYCKAVHDERPVAEKFMRIVEEMD
jgi:hypothetical protein